MRFLFFFFIISCAFANPPLISLGGGWNDVLREKNRTGVIQLEYRFSQEYATIRPLVGIDVTWKKAVYAYGGFWLDWLLWNHLIFSPNFSVGYYYKGNDKDLGFPLEFRSGIEGGWRFCNDVRIGAHFFHISNASLGKKNPGTESLILFLSIPINNGSKK